jgi:hypothetical protein
MKNFRVRTLISAALVLILSAALALPIVQAQETTATPQATAGSPIACDSALALLVAVAQKNFGFTVPSDIGPFDWGQYSGLFTSSSAPASTPEAAMSAGSSASGIMLQLPVVLGEDPQCTQLRTDVVNFLTGNRSASSASASSTPEATAMATAAAPASTMMPAASTAEATAMPSASTPAATAAG